jgi:organic radical activating enzyme
MEATWALNSEAHVRFVQRVPLLHVECIFIPMRKARVIITFACPKKCPGCCNTYSDIMSQAKPLNNVKQLKGFDLIMITGGEPMLTPDRVVRLANIFRKVAPNSQIYLYTALNHNSSDMSKVIDSVDGIQYTLHAEANDQDVAEFYAFQELAKKWASNKSFRLFVDDKMKGANQLKIVPSVWKRVEVGRWKSEDELKNIQPGGLPSQEELFILSSKPKTDVKECMRVKSIKLLELLRSI